MSELPKCPECSSVYTYEVQDMYACPECGHEWAQHALQGSEDASAKQIKDAVGNVLQDLSLIHI